MAILGKTKAYVFTSRLRSTCCCCKRGIPKGTAHARVENSGYALKLCAGCLFDLDRDTQALLRKQRRTAEKLRR